MKPMLILAIVVGGGLVATLAAAQVLRSGYDEPRHEVLVEDGQFQIRSYAARIVAETFVSTSDWRGGTSTGFSRLAGFIFGGNLTSEGESSKIAMTTPVESVPSSDGYIVVFTMPPSYTLDTLPKPTDQSVTIREIGPSTVATLRFSGNARGADIEQLSETLLARVTKNGWVATSTVKVAQYDPPWIPGPLRRNEVMVDVKLKTSAP
jgi:hypothetical protein